jgi:arylsulfatase A-like enzyme
MLSRLDQCVGDVVAALAERRMLNNSIIIFSTDNGGPAAGFNLNAASNWPLKGVNFLYKIT